MFRRALASVLWFYLSWYAVSLASVTLVPLPAATGPLLGLVVAGVVVANRRRHGWRQSVMHSRGAQADVAVSR